MELISGGNELKITEFPIKGLTCSDINTVVENYFDTHGNLNDFISKISSQPNFSSGYSINPDNFPLVISTEMPMVM